MIALEQRVKITKITVKDHGEVDSDRLVAGIMEYLATGHEEEEEEEQQDEEDQTNSDNEDTSSDLEEDYLVNVDAN